MAEINWTDEAEDWLKKIYDYISEEDKDTAVWECQPIVYTLLNKWKT